MPKRLSFILLLLFSIHSYGQNMLFEHLRMENGLSQPTINSIYQDEFSQIWIATRDGLNRYNGTNIQIFRPQIADTTGLFGSNVQTVTGDRNGRIFIQCLYGLILFDLKKQSMRRIAMEGVECISYGNDRLWTGNQDTIKFLDIEKCELVFYLNLKQKTRISSIKESADGTLYIGTKEGLYYADKNKRISLLIGNIDVVSIYEDSQKNCWIGTVSDGLYRIDTRNEVTNYTYKKGSANCISGNFVRAICQDNLGYYWIGTSTGLDKLDMSTNTFSNLYHSEEDVYSIGNSSVWCITKDIQGSLWIGTFFGGVDFINPDFSFSQYYRVREVGKGLSSSVVSNVTEDKDGNLWICTENAGLNYFDRKNNVFSWYKHSETDNSSLSSNIIKSIWLDEDNNKLWIGTHLGGLNCFDLTTKKSTRFLQQNNTSVRGIIPYDNELLLGTNNSVSRFNPSSGEKYPLLNNKKYDLENKQIWDMMLDSNENLWFSTSFAVYKYNFARDSVTIYNSNGKESEISPGFINAFFEDSRNRIWLGSAGFGLNLYDPDSDSFMHYNTFNSALLDDYILDIQESPMGYLLIATNKGLSRFDLDSNVFYNYENISFFPFSMINEQSLYVTKRGEIVICSLNGMVILNEKDLNLKPVHYKVQLTNLYVNNRLVMPGDDNNILQQSLLYTKNLNLKHKHTTFSVEFASTNYIKAVNPQIQYKLEGFDKDWINANNRNIITYTNLTPGDYVLKLRAYTNIFNNYTEETMLDITIDPPFYKTIWAYLMYLIVFVVLFYIIASNYISRVKLKSSLEYAEKEKEQTEELNQSKLRFFTNISHEFRTPVTLIISQLDTLIQTTNISPYIRSRLSNVIRHAESMQKLINELLDFRKQEQGFVKLKVTQNNLIEFLYKIYLTYNEYLKRRNIEFSFACEETDIEIWYDTNQMEKVFHNLLTNALKYTPDGGKINIGINRTKENVSIEITDSGIGIDKESLEYIFERFYQAKNKNADENINVGTGIGLALVKSIIESHKGSITVDSEQGKGSCFRITLRYGNEHFTPDEIVENKSEYLALNDIQDVAETDEKISQNETNENVLFSDDEKPTLLIVEDNIELANILSERFAYNYKVITAKDGVEGFEKTLRIQPNIVITDVMMPKMSGIEMCRKIKENVNTCHIPIIMLTARTATEHTIEGLSSGADDYITKPFNPKILIARCNNLIASRRMIQNHFLKNIDNSTQQLTTTPYDKELLERAIRIVEMNIDNPEFDVGMFAQEMCLGRTSLNNKIKGITGQTPNEFIINVRLKKSLVYLQNEPNTTIAEIAFRSGFSDASYFNKQFKKLFGKTPNQYKHDK